MPVPPGPPGPQNPQALQHPAEDSQLTRHTTHTLPVANGFHFQVYHAASTVPMAVGTEFMTSMVPCQLCCCWVQTLVWESTEAETVATSCTSRIPLWTNLLSRWWRQSLLCCCFFRKFASQIRLVPTTPNHPAPPPTIQPHPQQQSGSLSAHFCRQDQAHTGRAEAAGCTLP